MKKVSLLVTVYNAEENLAATLQSIEEQVYQNIEVVIVDGGSTDGTVALIRQFENRTADRAGLSLRWVSEKDQGLYDAMNKAYRLSTGDIIAVCNDRLCEPEAVSSLAAAVEAGGEVVWVHIPTLCMWRVSGLSGGGTWGRENFPRAGCQGTRLFFEKRNI